VIQKIKQFILEKYLDNRLRQGRATESVQDFVVKIGLTRHILLVMPSEPAIEDELFDFASKLYTVFGDVKISTFEKKSIRPEDCNWFGLAHQQYLKDISKEKIDLIIDLNLNPDKLCAYLCLISNAPLRLNLSGSAYDHLYNLHIRSRQGAHLSERLQSILRYLSTLRAPVKVPAAV
jgi:hypothetical protein